MATEAQRQQRLIGSGFLDNLGSTDAALSLDQTEAVFTKWMGKVVERLQERLNSANAAGREITASGGLSESIRFEYRKDDKGYIGEIYMADYADYVDKGVQGIGPNNQNTTSPYKFKTAFPSKNMQKALILWVREKSITESYTKADGSQGSITHKGLFGKSTSGVLRNKARANSLAMAMGVSIKRKGIKPTNFKQGVVDELLPLMAEELAAGMAKDIRVSINVDALR